MDLTARKENSYQSIFFVLCALVLVVYPLLSLDFGITWDEWLDTHNAMLNLRYLLTGGRDTIFLTFSHGYLYSHLFYSLVALIYGTFHGGIWAMAHETLHSDQHLIGFYTVSHVINALFGVLAAVYTGLLAKKIANWRAACLALIFIVFSPRFLGNSMNDPKDIPFAANSIFTFYYLIAFLEELPKPRIRTLVLLAAGIGMTIGTRSGGLLLIAYLFMFTGLWWLDHKGAALVPPGLRGRFAFLFDRLRLQRAAEIKTLHIAGYVLAAAVTGYFLGLIFWPYGQLNPLVNPLLALRVHSKSAVWTGSILFEGTIFPAGGVPWYYIPKWILISSPVYILMGMALFLTGLRRCARLYAFRLWGPVLFAAVFPIAFVIYRQSMLLDSWRHLLFVYPPIVILCALAWESLFQMAENRNARILLAGLLALLLAGPMFWMIRNHPNEYVYFNPLTGGIDGAFAKYETDYWGNCMREASGELADYHLKNHPGEPALVRADSSVMSSYPFLRKALGNYYQPYGYPLNFIRDKPAEFINYGPWRRGQDWNYAIVMPRGWDPAVLKSPAWPPAGTVREVKADDVVLCAVVRNPDFRGWKKERVPGS